MTLPCLSIVLPVHNGEAYLSQSIQTIIAQRFTEWELIIVDDASTDDTANIIHAYTQ